MRSFHILIVYAVKICKQCLQTASAYPVPGLRPSTLLEGLPSPRFFGYSRHPQMKIPGASIAAGLTGDSYGARHGL